MTRTLPTDTPRKSVTRVGTLRISARSLKRVTCPSLGERRTWRRLLPRDTSWRRNAGGGGPELAGDAHEGDPYEHRIGQDRGEDERLCVEARLEGRQAVGAVVEARAILEKNV